MMNIDEKIKQELENDAENLDKILLNNEGVFDLLIGSFKGGMKRWVILMNVIAFIVVAIMFWTGYRFFTATEMQQQIFWGVSFLIATNFQIGIKQWLFMEMNRSSLMREIKRVEVAVTKLSTK